jgi:hypothetical protein
MKFRLKIRTLRKFTLRLKLIFMIMICFSSCTEEEICTRRVNIPIWNEQEQIFEDNFQDFPCDA